MRIIGKIELTYYSGRRRKQLLLFCDQDNKDMQHNLKLKNFVL